MSAPIDIYTYPENATPLELARYQVAVMEAYFRGEVAEVFQNTGWTKVTPSFQWHLSKYRIARPKIAEGHNPCGLTEAQVGVQDGWRLLTAEELNGDHPHDGIEFYRVGSWDQDFGHLAPAASNGKPWTFRTKNPPGHYLPKPAAEPVAETREETRRDRIAQAVRMIRDTSMPDEQVAARIDALLAREQSAPGLTLKDARDIIGQ